MVRIRPATNATIRKFFWRLGIFTGIAWNCPYLDGLLPGRIWKYINLTIFSDYFRLSNDRPTSKPINPKKKLTTRIPDLPVGLLSLMDHQNNPPLSIIPAITDISPNAVKNIPSKETILRNLSMNYQYLNDWVNKPHGYCLMKICCPWLFISPRWLQEFMLQSVPLTGIFLWKLSVYPLLIRSVIAASGKFQSK